MTGRLLRAGRFGLPENPRFPSKSDLTDADSSTLTRTSNSFRPRSSASQGLTAPKLLAGRAKIPGVDALGQVIVTPAFAQ